MIDYEKVPYTEESRQRYLEDCLGADCPLCKAGFKIKPKLIIKDEKTGKKYVLSASLSEKIYKIMESFKPKKRGRIK